MILLFPLDAHVNTHVAYNSLSRHIATPRHTLPARLFTTPRPYACYAQFTPFCHAEFAMMLARCFADAAALPLLLPLLLYAEHAAVADMLMPCC